MWRSGRKPQSRGFVGYELSLRNFVLIWMQCQQRYSKFHVCKLLQSCHLSLFCRLIRWIPPEIMILWSKYVVMITSPFYISLISSTRCSCTLSMRSHFYILQSSTIGRHSTILINFNFFLLEWKTIWFFYLGNTASRGEEAYSCIIFARKSSWIWGVIYYPTHPPFLTFLFIIHFLKFTYTSSFSHILNSTDCSFSNLREFSS